MNTRYQVYAVVNDMMEIEILTFTNSPRKAIECFFEHQEYYPSCVAIIADKYYDAQLLVEFASARHDIINECYEEYKHIPYKKEYILDTVDKYTKSDKYKKDGLYMDQVHPFSLG